MQGSSSAMVRKYYTKHEDVCFITRHREIFITSQNRSNYARQR